ncbi:hypothetical protein E5D57_007694 [Metarhizium anisopliae]|nr:hypothetical protein E5D57_007694 [Metarhizium anisopliae]
MSSLQYFQVFRSEGTRLAAIRLLASTLDAEPKTAADADALFAATYCLMSQSSLMPNDGMAEYMALMRGAILVMTTILPEFPNSIFSKFAGRGILHLPGVDSS